MDNVIGIKYSVLSKDLFIAREIMYVTFISNKDRNIKGRCYVVILGTHMLEASFFRRWVHKLYWMAKYF